MTATLAKARLQTAIYALALCTSVDAFAEEEEDELPDLEFLEYLGMWEDSDEEWLLLEDDVMADNEDRSDPVPKGEASTEKEDES